VYSKYNNGSVLRMHVDTVNTHVVSAIINVDQEVEQDWPLLILDHSDNEHRVVMRAGDMVLYESAKLLHGRPGVLMSCSCIRSIIIIIIIIIITCTQHYIRSFCWEPL